MIDSDGNGGQTLPIRARVSDADLIGRDRAEGESRQVQSRPWHQRRQAQHELQRAQHQTRGPSRQAVLSLSTTCPAALHCTRSLARAGYNKSRPHGYILSLPEDSCGTAYRLSDVRFRCDVRFHRARHDFAVAGVARASAASRTRSCASSRTLGGY